MLLDLLDYTADRDYNEVLNVPIALMGNQNITIQVSLIDDKSGEGEEKFMGQLELTQEYPRVQLTNPTTTITILDNGELFVSASKGWNTVLEVSVDSVT